MTDEELENLKRLAQAATPGPWVTSDDGHTISSYHPERGYCIHMGYPDRDAFWAAMHKVYEADSRYIAAANPQTILSLIEGYERMREALRPFANATELTDDYPDEAACLRAAFDWRDKSQHPEHRSSVTVGDLRRARTALGE